jgi:hypothetical protein
LEWEIVASGTTPKRFLAATTGVEPVALMKKKIDNPRHSACRIQLLKAL